MNTVNIDQLVNGLCDISDSEFVCEPVYDFLSEHPVDVDSIQKYLYWSPNFYTRNLIYKDVRFEMMAICWEKGQVSRVHNHWEQRCWMTVPVGKLKGQNFAVEAIDESTGYCKLIETNEFELTECLATRVDLDEPIHQVLNLPEFDERAVSIHIYSKPYDRCLSYCRDTDTYKEVQLFYTSIDGKLCDGITL
ncbi:MAG TPA: cysteine dioxygenase family protein [Pyrinomonadaceae bacterium]|nr:cysteine dioxygenase family protein [Pyrinomonadaceae bacterium]